MGAWRLRHAKTAASLAVISAIAATVAATSPIALTAASAHPHSLSALLPHTPSAHGRSDSSASNLAAGAGSTEAPAAASSPAATPLAAARSPSIGARGRVRVAGQQRQASVRALGGGANTQISAHPARKLGSSGSGAIEGAVSQALALTQNALHTAESLSQQSGLAGRHHGGGRGTHGKGGGRGKHHGSPGEAPEATGTAGGESHTVTPAPASAVAATPAATVAAAPRASAPAPLVPKVASVAAQPFGQVSRGSGHTASGSHRRGRVAAALAPALLGAAPAAAPAAESAAAPAAVNNARPASKAAASHSPNTLERIGRQIPLPIPVPDWSKPVIIALLVLALALAVRAAAAGARARRLERQSVGLLRDLGTMQAALVPEVPQRVGGLDVSVAYRPAEGPAAGGDFYDLFVPRPGVVAMMLGDISGHGHEALTHAALARYTLRAYLQAGLEPRVALALAGRVLNDPSGARYATVAVGIYDDAAGTLTYSLAGHPPPVFIGAPGLEPVTAASSPPVGWSVPTGRRQTTVSLPRGSEVCFFSDGLVEARNEGRLLGRERLRQLLAGLGAQPQAEQLLEEVRRAAPSTPDDMVACILSAPGGPLAPSLHVEELEVDAQALQRSGVRRFLCECKVPPTELATALRKARELVASTGGALLRVDVAASSSVHVSAPPAAEEGVRAARGPRAREELALASLAVAS